MIVLITLTDESHLELYLKYENIVGKEEPVWTAKK